MRFDVINRGLVLKSQTLKVPKQYLDFNTLEVEFSLGGNFYLKEASIKTSEYLFSYLESNFLEHHPRLHRTVPQTEALANLSEPALH